MGRDTVEREKRTQKSPLDLTMASDLDQGSLCCMWRRSESLEGETEGCWVGGDIGCKVIGQCIVLAVGP